MREIGVGIIGFGTVGTGVVKILQENGELIAERLGGRLAIRKIADIDLQRERDVEVPSSLLTTDAHEVIRDPRVDVVVELIGGEEPARSLILEAIREGKHVVTANKALLAHRGREIFEAAKERGVQVGFEASVGGGIPIIRSLNEGLVANRIRAIFGILNGTSNYILTRMTEQGEEFGEALREAQSLGYAEADPRLDVEGIDAAHKLTILASLASGSWVEFERVYVEGITRITPLDIQFSMEFGYRIKLLAIAKMTSEGVELRVHPTMLPRDHLLAQVEGVYNAIYVTGDMVGPTMFYGQGAGGLAAGSAVVSDLVSVGKRILEGAKGRGLLFMGGPVTYKAMEDLVCPYYLRFTAVDRPGVLSKISGILGANEISIASVIQKGREVNGAVPVVMMTHEAREEAVKRALEEIDRLEVIKDKTTLIRVEEGS